MENKCERCICNPVCDHNRFGYENCDNFKDKALCVEVLCKVGDKVYLFDNALHIHEFVISSYDIYSNGESCYCARCKIEDRRISKLLWSYEFDKTVFFTKEDAEKFKKRNRGKLWLMKRTIVRM